MTYQEIKDLKMCDVVIKTDLKKLAKECLSIIDTSTLKDNEILLFINAGATDMKRLGIDVDKKIEDQLIQAAIVMFVKANFGIVDIKEKQRAQETYIQICNNLSLSDDYKIKEEVDNNA